MKKAIVRLVVLAVLLANQSLVMFGWDPLPFTEEEIYAGISSFVTFLGGLWVWYKNNNLTDEAEEAQRLLDAKKAKKKIAKQKAKKEHGNNK